MFKILKKLQKKFGVCKIELSENQIPYIVDGELFQVETKKYNGFEKGKRYTPLNTYELSIIKPRAIDLNGKIIIETEI